MVPALWKVGMVRLIHKKDDPMRPTNWRPICLQPVIYKLYSGLLARRLSCWLELNDQLPMAQKGLRAFNGCHEHNFWQFRCWISPGGLAVNYTKSGMTFVMLLALYLKRSCGRCSTDLVLSPGLSPVAKIYTMSRLMDHKRKGWRD